MQSIRFLFTCARAVEAHPATRARGKLQGAKGRARFSVVGGAHSLAVRAPPPTRARSKLKVSESNVKAMNGTLAGPTQGQKSLWYFDRRVGKLLSWVGKDHPLGWTVVDVKVAGYPCGNFSDTSS